MLQEQERQHQQSFSELEDLRRRFRQSSYDSRHSYFPSGFELAALLGMLMSGRASGGDIWDRIDREQRFRRPRTPPDFGGGVFPGGFGGGGRGGFGGGRRGGGMGGGGFRTGGTFLNAVNPVLQIFARHPCQPILDRRTSAHDGLKQS